MNMLAKSASAEPTRKTLNVVLWIVQLLLAIFFVWAAWTKLFAPSEQLVHMLPWAAEHPALVKVTGLVDLAGGLGIILPALTRITPILGVFAALGLVVLQMLAMIFHLSRGEAMLVPMNIILLLFATFVLWGRRKAAPITPRTFGA